MSPHTLNCKPTRNPDFSGGLFYVEAGRLFDADDYAQHAKINRHDIDAQSVHSVQYAAEQLNTGEWLLVDHE